MMDLMLGFRDRESAAEMNELLHANTELSEDLERWQQRCREMQKERWGFVERWRSDKKSASEGQHVRDEEQSADESGGDSD